MAPSTAATRRTRADLAEVKGRVITPEDPAYDRARTIFYGGIDKRPSAIVRASDAADVRRVIATARNEGYQLAVRSGGHSIAGRSTTDSGLVIDLHPEDEAGDRTSSPRDRPRRNRIRLRGAGVRGRRGCPLDRYRTARRCSVWRTCMARHPAVAVAPRSGLRFGAVATMDVWGVLSGDARETARLFLVIHLLLTFVFVLAFRSSMQSVRR